MLGGRRALRHTINDFKISGELGSIHLLTVSPCSLHQDLTKTYSLITRTMQSFRGSTSYWVSVGV